MESGLYIVGVGLGAEWGWNGCRDGAGLRTFICADAIVFPQILGHVALRGIVILLCYYI